MECKKCNGTGQYAGFGDCFDCRGSGQVQDLRYKTTPAAESSHPALRAEREREAQKPFLGPTEHGRREIARIKEMLRV